MKHNAPRLAFGLGFCALVMIASGSAGCAADVEEESTRSSSEALVETCQPLVKSAGDVTCQTMPTDVASQVNSFISNEIGTCGACAFSVGSMIVTGGATLPALIFTGAGCFGCANYIVGRLNEANRGASCSIRTELASGCNVACARIGYAYATATMSTSSATDVSCSCGTSRDANLCCSTAGVSAGRNGQRSCDPQRLGSGGTASGGAGTGGATPTPTQCAAGEVAAPACRTSYTSLTCGDAGYAGRSVGSVAAGASLVRCSRTRNGCGVAAGVCATWSTPSSTGCKKNYDGYDDYCQTTQHP